ncbi:D-3-phosphoglycerate dehydrogenase [Paraburkholderia sp. GV068]|uniref:hydroxyacid dehydrogenase n=1 Tax=unclassified Paraburkholderia TaxID=2615204 RepID=UPI000D46371A|nr:MULTISPECIES: hydroxyacid dehydrogenase [unclassified Paraburkholderia]PTQ93366.1 D-3-phosphoglycerate dehydrogenase [Paraburkholderia sp. GV072]PUB00013.1 D-3-phosphoglycerate dehydrogenase [Paraburkholderia sp. GV068]
MKVFVMDPIDPSAVELLSRAHTVVNYPESRSADWHTNADAVVVRTFEVRATDFPKASNLKIVAKHGTGVDNVDIEAASEAGVLVTNTPGANANAVAEYALAIALALARKVSVADRTLRLPAQTQLQGGVELTGKTVGLLGFGDIGRRTARLFKAAFGSELVVYDPYAPQAAFAELGAIRVNSIHELLPLCDLVSLHLPLLAATKNLIGEAEFKLMRDSALFVNVARGGIVDEGALYQALVDGQIAGAASDVFETEPVPASHPLLTLENFVASPHIAASSKESLVRMGHAAAHAVIEALAGRTPPHQVLPKPNVINAIA